MNDAKPIDVQAEVKPEPSMQQAITVRDAVLAVEKSAEVKAVTAAQAKVEAIANLTHSAYAKASELRLTPEESAALQAPFADDDFQAGAAGKENLIYIQHSALRDRFNKVLGLGQWSVIPRSRWAQEDRDSTTVYVEAMLLIRGCFVAESIGDMVYWPKNRSTNYGDAVEGATTQAFRRCAKMFGVGLQAWDKAWCEQWWQRRRNAGQKAPAPATQPQKQPQPPTEQHGSEKTYPIVTVLTVKEQKSKPDAAKKWTAYFIRFSDGFGELEAATFDSKIATLANELANTGENAVLKTKPGSKPGTTAIVSLERADQPPTGPGVGSDNVPMDFDEAGQPIDINA